MNLHNLHVKLFLIYLYKLQNQPKKLLIKIPLYYHFTFQLKIPSLHGSKFIISELIDQFMGLKIVVHICLSVNLNNFSFVFFTSICTIFKFVQFF